MGIYIFHGDNLASSRGSLQAFLTEARKSSSILSLEGAKLSPVELESTLHTQNLFGDETIVIEQLFSRPKSKDQAACLTLLHDYQGPKQIVLWDKKELTKTQLKPFSKATIKLHKTPPLVFQLVDAVKGDNREGALHLLHKAALVADDGFLFIMLSRRVSDLITVKSGDTDALSPWLRSRLISQARTFDENTLLSFHHALSTFDSKLKTGATALSYLDQLDILFASLLR